METATVRVDTELDGAGDTPTATASAVPTVVPATLEPDPIYAPIESLICSYDWNCASALCIAWAESRYDPFAYNPDSGTSGLMQIRPSVHAQRISDMGYTLDDLFDPVINLEIAYAIYLDWEGFGAFDGSPQCY